MAFEIARDDYHAVKITGDLADTCTQSLDEVGKWISTAGLIHWVAGRLCRFSGFQFRLNCIPHDGRDQRFQALLSRIGFSLAGFFSFGRSNGTLGRMDRLRPGLIGYAHS